MPSRSERREQQTARIMEAAKTCFVRSGFKGASMQELCQEAEMSPGALYRYFPSKEAIIEAIVEEDRKRDAEILSRMMDNDDVVEGIIESFMAHMKLVHETGFSALFTEVRAEAMRNGRVAEACDRNMEQLRTAFRAYLQKASDRGAIDPEIPLDTLITMMFALGEGLIMADPLADGTDPHHIETMMRNCVIGNLRPTQGNA